MKRLPSLLLAATLAATSAHAVSLFHESFDGNDQNWSYSSTGARSYDNQGWTEVDTVKPGYKGVKLGSTSAIGTITSPSFALNNRSQPVVVTIVAAAYSHTGGGKEGIALAVYDDSDASIFTDSVEELTQFSSTAKDEIPANATFTQTFTIPAASLPVTGNVKLSITSTYTVSGQRRALIGDVLVEQNPPALAAPTPLASSSVTASGFTVSWTGVSGAEGYTVALLDSTGTTTIDTASYSSSETTASFSGLSSSTTYRVSVIARGNGTTSSDSPAATLSVTTAPPAANDPPVVTITLPDGSCSSSATAGESFSATVTATKGTLSAMYDDQNSSSYGEYGFDEISGFFNFIPTSLGQATFVFSATDDSGDVPLEGSATLTVNVDHLATPQNLSASVSGTAVSATWDTVQGADNYEATLYGDTAFTLDLGGISDASSWQTLSGSFSGGSMEDSARWSSSPAGARVNTSDAWFDQAKPAIAIRSGSYPFTVGPFDRDILSFSFKYRKASGSNTGHIHVYAIDSYGLETEIANSTTSGTGHLGNMDQPASTEGTYVFATNFVDRAFSARSIKITCTTSPVLIDDFEVHTLAAADVQEVSAPTHATTFSGLDSATYYAVGVKAKGSPAGAESVASEEAVSELVRTAGNTPPTLSVSSATVPAGTAAVLALNGHDDDGDALTYAVSPAGVGEIVVDSETGAASFTYTPNAVGSTAFTFTATDPSGAYAEAQATVTATLGTPAVSATATDCTVVTLGWDAVTGAAGYRVAGSGTKIGVAGTKVIEETFDKFETISSDSTKIDENADTYMDHAGWTLVNAYRGDNSSSNDPGQDAAAGKFGTGSYAGSLTSPALDLSGNDGAFVVTFSARRWGGDTGAKVAVVVNGATNETQAVLSDSMATYAISCTGGTSATVVQITGAKAKNCRFFLDDLKIVSGAATVKEIAIAPEQLSVSGTTCTAIGLTPDATYTFTVTAYADDDGTEVTTSATASVSTPEAPKRTLILFR